MNDLLRRLRFLLRQTLMRRRRQNELDEELQFHVEQTMEAHLSAGMSPEEARRLGQNGFASVVARFDPEVEADRLADLYTRELES